MLMLDGDGSYHSKSDCYYEDEGIDIDNKNVLNSKAEYIKIKYCTFCSKEIKSVFYEKTKTNDEIAKLKNKLKEFKIELDYSTMFINFEWKLKKELQKKLTKCLKNIKKKWKQMVENSLMKSII